MQAEERIHNDETISAMSGLPEEIDEQQAVESNKNVVVQALNSDEINSKASSDLENESENFLISNDAEYVSTNDYGRK